MRAFYFRDTLKDDPFANIKRFEYVCNMHFRQKMKNIDGSLANIKRRESVPGKRIAKLKCCKQKTVYPDWPMLLENNTVKLELYAGTFFRSFDDASIYMCT